MWKSAENKKHYRKTQSSLNFKQRGKKLLLNLTEFFLNCLSVSKHNTRMMQYISIKYVYTTVEQEPGNDYMYHLIVVRWMNVIEEIPFPCIDTHLSLLSQTDEIYI